VIYKQLIKYPQYYCVDFEIFVTIVKKGKNVAGYNHLGNPYPVGKAIVDGQPITEAQYEKGVQNYLKSEKLKETKFQKWVQRKIKSVRLKTRK